MIIIVFIENIAASIEFVIGKVSDNFSLSEGTIIYTAKSIRFAT
jgi:hypothetical protein